MNNKMKKILILSLCINFIFVIGSGFIITRHIIIKSNTTEVFSPTHTISKSVFNGLKTDKDDIIFVGDSLTDLCEWSELLDSKNIKNRGIPGDRTSGILDIINDISIYKPEKIFLMVGINDLNDGADKDTILKNYKSIINNIITNSPNTEIFIQSVLPINDSYKGKANNEDIISLNTSLQEIKGNKIVFINIYDEFVDKNNKLKADLSTDGLHLNYKGYTLWKSILDEYIK